jgi:PQQ enzyme repeat
MVENALIGTTEFDIFSINPTTCAENWRTREVYPPSLLPANRGAAYMDGALFRGTQDGRVLAYDFKTGKRLWENTDRGPETWRVDDDALARRESYHDSQPTAPWCRFAHARRVPIRPLRCPEVVAAATMSGELGHEIFADWRYEDSQTWGLTETTCLTWCRKSEVGPPSPIAIQMGRRTPGWRRTKPFEWHRICDECGPLPGRRRV